MVEKIIVISVSGYEYTLAQAMQALADAGITYAGWGGSNMTDSMRFEDCKNVPETLPDGMTMYRQNRVWSDIDGWGVEING